MELEQSFIALIEQSIKTNWYLNALTDYKGIHYNTEMWPVK